MQISGTSPPRQGGPTKLDGLGCFGTIQATHTHLLPEEQWMEIVHKIACNAFLEASSRSKSRSRGLCARVRRQLLRGGSTFNVKIIIKKKKKMNSMRRANGASVIVFLLILPPGVLIWWAFTLYFWHRRSSRSNEPHGAININRHGAKHCRMATI